MLGRFREHRLRFDRGMLDELRLEPPLDLEIGRGETLLDVPPPDFMMHEDVPLRVDPRRILPHGDLRIGDDRKRLIHDVDKAECFPRDFTGAGGDECNAVSEIPHLLPGEYLLVLHDDAEGPVPRYVRRGKHRFDAGQFLRFLLVDRHDASVRVLRAEHLPVQLVGERIIVGELRRPRDLSPGVNTPLRTSYHSVLVRIHCPFIPVFSRAATPHPAPVS